MWFCFSRNFPFSKTKAHNWKFTYLVSVDLVSVHLVLKNGKWMLLQAKWVNDPEQMSLRCKDILPVVERGHVFRTRSEPQHPSLLPAVRPHHKLLLRFVILARQKTRYSRIEEHHSDWQHNRLNIRFTLDSRKPHIVQDDFKILH